MSQPSVGPKGRNKSRIVVDVAQIQAEAQDRRRRRVLGRGAKILSAGALVAAALAVALLAGGYLWWRSFARGPAYSLALLVDASRRDDLREVETLIDSDRIAEGFVPQVVDKLAGGAAAGTLAVPPVPGQLANVIPQLIPRVRETMREEIARAVKGAADEGGANLPFFLFAFGVSRAADVREEGDTATVAFDPGRRPVELSMQRTGDRWKVVTVKDEVMATDIATRLAASLPAPAASAPAQGTPRRRGRSR